MASNNNVKNTSRDYSSIKEDLISMSEKYYPTIAESFNDSSVGSWFIDLVASVGDSLNYAIDRNFQETQTTMSNTMETALNNAQTNGVKVCGSKASSCEVRFSCVLPAASATNLSSPDWDYAPVIKRGAVVACGSYSYELQEDVNFKEQFNSEGFSNRTFTPNRDSNGVINGYTVTKTAIVVGGTSKVYKRTISASEIEPFMEIVLPDTDVMNVEGVIFKETSNYNISPNIYEYYIPREMWINKDESVYTHRFFEVESLADQYAFVDESDVSDLDGRISSVIYEEMDDNGTITSHLYKGKWLTVRQKFITEYTSNGYMKLIFGASNAASEIPSGQTDYADYFMSNVLNNQFLGVLPDANWTMFVLYRVGGGMETNVAPNSIKTISYMSVETPYLQENYNQEDRTTALNSITVTNTSPSIGGKDFPSVEEVNYLTKYAIGAQGRCVTLKDYKARILMMPPRYGCPFRLNVMEENNKILISMLGINSDGTLSNTISSTLRDNIITYLSNYKMLSDYIELRSGKIYNVSFEISLYIDKNYDTNSVATDVINEVTEYMNINKHDMGEDIFLGDMQKEITNIDGVISIIDFAVYNETNGVYSSNKVTLPTIDDGDGRMKIDLDSLDGMLPSDFDSMYEIKQPKSDIKLKIKLK